MKLKHKIAMKIIQSWLMESLAKILEVFKAKNPYVWGVISVLCLILQFGLQSALVTLGFDFALAFPPEFLSLDWILSMMNLHLNDTLTDLIMSILMLVTGSKTALYLPKAQSAKVIEDLADKSAQRQRQQ